LKPIHTALFAGAALSTLLAGASARAQAVDPPTATYPARAAGPTASPDAPSPVDEVVVTANRSEEPRDRVPFSITALDRAAIRASQATVVSDLLAQTPGVGFARNGGPGALTGVFIRGAGSDETLVLIDGVRVNDPTDPGGAYDFGQLLTGDISRIEVLRGPQSTLWGSQAIGGVVNIVTAPPGGPPHGEASFEGGSYGTTYERASVAGTAGPVALRLGGGYYDTGGVSAFDRKFGGRETDGFHQGQLSGRADVTLTRYADLDLRAYYSEGRTSIDGYPPPSYALADGPEFQASRQLTDYAGLNVALFDGRLKNRIAFEYAENDRDIPAVTDYDSPAKYAGVTQRYEYQGTAALPRDGKLVFGAERERSGFADLSSSPQSDPRNNVTIDSGYAQVSGDVVRDLTLTAGVRHDSHQTFGDHDTGQVGAAWRLNGGATILRSSWGTGFKAPTLYQLYSDYGNTRLKPEEAEGWDGGVEQRFWDGRVVLQAGYFGRDTSNLIAFFYCGGGADPLCAGPGGPARLGYYANVAKAHAEGAELQGEVAVTPRLSLSGEYTYTHSVDRSTGSFTFGKLLARRPQDTASSTLTYAFPDAATAAVAVRYAGDSFDDAANTIRLKAYTLVDLRGSYPLPRRFAPVGLELYGRIENLFDARYETAYRYGTLGRGAYAGVRAKF